MSLKRIALYVFGVMFFSGLIGCSSKNPKEIWADEQVESATVAIISVFSMARIWLACTFSLVLIIVVISGGCNSDSDAQKQLEAYRQNERRMDELNQSMREFMESPSLSETYERAKAFEEEVLRGSGKGQ